MAYLSLLGLQMLTLVSGTERCGGSLYIFWDRRCGQEEGTPPMWILSPEMPDPRKLRNLQEEEGCHAWATWATEQEAIAGVQSWTSFDPCCTSRAGTGFQARVVSFENDSIQVSGLCDTDGGMRLANRVFRIEGTTVTGRYWYSSQCSGEHCYYEVQVPEDFESHAQEPEHHLEEGGEPRGYQDEEDDDADDLLVTAHSISGFALLAVGILQTLLACGRLQKRKRRLPLQPGDAEVLSPRRRGSGSDWHRSVPQSAWCVTLEDLCQFRRLVMHAVETGKIRPHDRDMFDTSDLSIGPSVYTVNDQFIKPVTARAGNMSWALLKNPAGVSCDVFVTHCWAEGIYEFIDRVEHSWPRGARAAYVCFLSNPQNLDIAGLIASPRESPFALALQAAPIMLVLPNHSLSIYTRLWCCYEAFLAYSWRKTIRVAKRHHDGLWWCMLRLGGLYVAAAGATCLLPMRVDMAVIGELNTILSVAAGISYVLAAAFVQKGIFGALALALNALTGICLSTGLLGGYIAAVGLQREMFYSGQDLGRLLTWLCGLVITYCLEFDRIMASDASLRSKLLRKDFSGRLLDARCSSDSDRESILEELSQSGKAKEVEEAVKFLLQMNLMTPELQRTTALTGELGDVSLFKSSWVAVGVMLWVALPIQTLTTPGLTPLQQVPAAAMLVQGCLWLAFFPRLSAERKTFASVTLNFWELLGACILVVFLIEGSAHVDWYLIPGALIVSPFCLSLSIAGPSRIARIPTLGVPVVRFFLGQKHRHLCPERRSRQAKSSPEDVQDATVTVDICSEVPTSPRNTPRKPNSTATLGSKCSAT
ncbi:unnamed protein product [Symbiodinium microadriaticum]|nr:unnamed protein product [Symbiodinium microadriaticum]CAE7920525.1 unnamed protein product [Symbiodinium sp. KB8]